MTNFDKDNYKKLLKDVDRCKRIAQKNPKREFEYFYCFGMNEEGRKWSIERGYPVDEENIWGSFPYRKEQNGYKWALERVPYIEPRKRK